MLKKLFLALCALFVLLITIPNFLDWNRYKPTLLNEIRTRTGVDVAIDGDLTLSIFPNPKLVAHNVTVKNVPQAPIANGVRVRKLACYIQLMPLFSKEVVVDSLAIEDAIFHNKDEKGVVTHLEGVTIQGKAASLKGPYTAYVTIKSILYDSYVASNFQGHVDFSEGKLTLKNLACEAYEGALTAEFTWQSNSLAGSFHVKHLNLASLPPLQKSALKKGLLDLDVTSIRANTSKPDAILKSLSCSMDGKVTQGMVEAMDVQSFVKDVQQVKTLQDVQKLQTYLKTKSLLAFESFQMQGILNDEVVNMSKVDLVSPFATLNSQGTVSLATHALHFPVTIHLKEAKNFPSIPLVVQGTWDAPSFSFDEKELLKVLGNMVLQNVAKPVIEKAKQKIQEKVVGHLKDAIGNVAEGILPQQPAANSNKPSSEAAISPEQINPQKIIQGLLGR
jgi:uncharacterized protein involved in outer membrane biogenesis